MTFRLPRALRTDDDGRAVELLRGYYYGDFDGALFDSWDTTGTRARDADHFVADDLLAIRTLNVEVKKKQAHRLLVDEKQHLHELLVQLGPDRDLVDEADPLGDDWPGWRLVDALKGVPGVGPTTATKLVARKRPRLRPIWDRVVARVTDTEKRLWEPLRVALREDDAALHYRLLRLHRAATLPPEVTPLRVLDVICWREGKDEGLRDREEVD